VGTDSESRESTMPLRSSLRTTRSGAYSAIASAFGVNDERSVTGASSG
jgi:hypothetical protein